MKVHGVQEALTKYRELEAQKEELERQQEAVMRAATARILGKSIDALQGEDTTMGSTYSRRSEGFNDLPEKPAELLQKRIEAAAGRLRQQHPVGRQLRRIDDLRRDIVNKIMGCSNHTKLENAWEEFQTQLETMRDDVLPSGERAHPRVRCDPARGEQSEG